MQDFMSFLNEKILKQMPRSELMIKLQLKYDEFAGLDAITLSRWSNGVTKPSLYRQLLIAHCVGCLDEYFERCDVPKVPKINEVQFRQYTSQFDSSYHQIKTQSIDSKVKYLKSTNKTTRRLYEYTFNIPSITEVVEHLDKQNITFDVETFYIESSEDIESCVYFHEYCEGIIEKFGVEEKINELNIDIDNLLFFGLTYFRSSVHCEVLLGLALNRLIHSYFNIPDTLLVARGSTSMRFLEELGANLVHSRQQVKGLGNMYIYHINTQKLCSNPKLLSLAVQYHPVYAHYFQEDKPRELNLDERLYEQLKQPITK
ncbi:hypothetical protein [Vibrio hyugaensis]|uniref:hypothetical protein n=1 Tax=Vibrio hyugaensis TaxID=1534743 RepID=UPI000CE5152F|nr:hypothetical protein [Vibrio hyugaensis]